MRLVNLKLKVKLLNGKVTEQADLTNYLSTHSKVSSFDYPMSDVLQGCLIVSIKKETKDDVRQFMQELWSLEEMKYNKFLIIVDEEVDAKDTSKVAWKVFNNIDAMRDLVISVKYRLKILDIV